MRHSSPKFEPFVVGALSTIDESGERVGHVKTALNKYLLYFFSLLLLVAPLLVYQRTIFFHFGLRDDYSNIREAHEEPGKILHLTASNGRPIYGLLLQHSFEHVNSLQDLQWLRLLGATGLGLICAAIFHLLLRLSWKPLPAFFTASALAFLPAAQVISSWAVAWPCTVAALISLMGFWLAHVAATEKKSAGTIAGIVCVGIGALIYQPTGLFYVLGIAGALVTRRSKSLKANLKWGAFHLGVIFAGLSLAFAVIKITYISGIFHPSPRIAFEHDLLGKMRWLVEEPLMNAFSLFVLNDDDAATWPIYAMNAQLVALLLSAGIGVERLRRGRSAAGFSLLALLILPLVGFGVSLIASERFATYRTTYAMAGVLLIFLSLAWQNLCSAAGPQGKYLQFVGFSGFLAVGVYLAQGHAFHLIALPQSQELGMIERGVKHLNLETHPKIFFVEPTLDDSPAAISYHDEFGSLSTNSEWVPKEIFKHALRERFPDEPNREIMCEFRSGLRLPKNERFDLVINMHRLRSYGTPYAGPFVEEIP